MATTLAVDASQGKAFLEACRRGDIQTVMGLVDSGKVPAFYADPGDSGWTALHFAVASDNAELVSYLLQSGAQWNALDGSGVTAAEVALSLNRQEMYELIKAEGIRTEMLLQIMAVINDNEQTEDDDDDGEASGEADTASDPSNTDQTTSNDVTLEAEKPNIMAGAFTAPADNNQVYLQSRLTYATDPQTGQEIVLAADGTGVMMGWERDIMRLTVEKMVDVMRREEGSSDLAVLNVGFGLGLVDSFLQDLKPTRHVIIEPHPDVLAYMRAKGWYDKAGVEILEGRWQDFVGQLTEFDMIYFDTFSEHYTDLKMFSEEIPTMLHHQGSVFSFFNGLGATNPLFYDVSSNIAELDLLEMSIGTTWHPIRVEDATAEQRWKDVVAKYWTLPAYKLPICQLNI